MDTNNAEHNENNVKFHHQHLNSVHSLRSMLLKPYSRYNNLNKEHTMQKNIKEREKIKLIWTRVVINNTGTHENKWNKYRYNKEYSLQYIINYRIQYTNY
mgnify:CR=1 FL=1